MNTNAPRVIIAGTHSGSGKTSIAVGLMAALRRHGLVVNPFKIGPDYIDPRFHHAACGVSSGTLDSWMLGDDGIRDSFLRTSKGDISIIEGMMGLHDGADPVADTGSTAHIARLLECPVILVIDASGVARSAGAMVLGYQQFAPDVKIAGVIANRVAGEGHAAYLLPAIESTGVPFLGWIPPNAAMSLPERHLGLVMPSELRQSGTIDSLADCIAGQIDLDEVIRISRSAPALRSERAVNRPALLTSIVRLGVAMDDAFCFYYPDNLALLEQAGAEIVPFSPIEDENLPDHIDGLYFGGGYPELHAKRLAGNASMLEAVRQFDRAGRPIFAECGGFMYLCDTLTTLEGDCREMAGLVRGGTRMSASLQTIGYRDVKTTVASILGEAGLALRGHEFRYSAFEGDLKGCSAAYLSTGAEYGISRGNLMASYVHLHFGSQPSAALSFVNHCLAARKT